MSSSASFYKGRLYFRTDDKSRQAYADRGMQPFRPSVKQTLKNYYEVPPDIVEDSEALVAWARKAMQRRAARRGSKG